MRPCIKLLIPFSGQLHPHILCVIHSAEDEGIDPLACNRRGIGIDHSFGCFDEQLNGDAADRESSPSFKLLQLPVQALDMVRPAAFGQADS